MYNLKPLNGAKECFSTIMSVFMATHSYEQGQIYFAVTYPIINSVHTGNQFIVVPYHEFSNSGKRSARPAGFCYTLYYLYAIYNVSPLSHQDF